MSKKVVKVGSCQVSGECTIDMQGGRVGGHYTVKNLAGSISFRFYANGITRTDKGWEVRAIYGCTGSPKNGTAFIASDLSYMKDPFGKQFYLTD